MVDFNNPHQLVDHLMTYRRPQTDFVVENMNDIRSQFITLGHNVVDILPDGPDKTVAIRKLHEALMAAIACLALNQ